MVFAVAYLVTGALAVLLRWPIMNFPLSEAYAFRQMQTTLMIREYMSGGLFQLSPLPLFGPPGQLPLEFPAFQWLAAVGGNLIGTTPQIAGRIAAMVFFLISAALIALIATRLYSKVTGFVAFVLFLFLPFGWQWGNAPLIEFAATASALASFYLIMLWVERRAWWLLVLLTITLSLAFLVKITTAVIWLVPLLALALVWQRRSNLREVINRWPLVIAFGVAGVIGLIWTRFSDLYRAENPFTYFLTSEALTTWNFGTIEQRLDTENWARISDYGDSIYGLLLVFFVLLVLAIGFWSQRMITIALASLLVIAPLIFFNLYYMHSYYLAAIYPALVIVMGAGLVGPARSIRPVISATARGAVIATSVFAVMALSWLSPEGQLVSQRSAEGLYQFPLAAELEANTPVDAGIITVGCDWDPAYFYLSGRRGLMLTDRNPSEVIPPEWIGKDLQFIATCLEDFDPRTVLDRNQPLIQRSDNVWEIL